MTSKVSGVSVEETTAARVILERHVRGAWRTDEVAEHDGWLILPEIPSSKEINPPGDDKPEPEEQWNDYQFDPVYDPQLPTNIVDGPWDSRSEYLKAHFEILREDAIAPLRNAVKAFKENPEMFDDASIRVYTHVYPTGILLTRNGPATRVEFSTERAAKQIRWEQSTRLMQGSMVALSPSSDNFKTICKVAIVAARPIFGGLDQNPPTIDLFWGEFNEAHIDCCEEWTMVEACEGFFEASRHMLAGLQLGKTEGIPLSTTVVKLTSKSQAPAYVKENPFFDLTRLEPPRKEGFENTLVDTDDTFDLSNVDVLQNFPSYVNNGMDTSQLLACKALLTQPVSIIQGPPGTGKTFVSIAALKVLVANLKPSDPPIIVSAQTNHALDQLLNHIMKFEPNLVRLGGRSAKDNTEIRKRTLYELREANRDVQDARQGLRIAHTTYVNLCNEIEAIVHPLKNGEIMTAQILVEHGILSEAQRSSLNSTGWGDDEDEEGRYGGVAEHIDVDLREWLGDDQIIPVPRAPNKHLGVLEEEVDLEVEQYQNLQENIAALQDDADEGLQGVWIPFGRKETGLAATGISASRISADVRALKDLNLVQPNERGRWYRGFELLLIRSIQSKLRKSLVKYKLAVQEYQVAKSICNLKIIRYLGIKVIGCTTTGLAKYRALLSALRSRTLLIEEAAETLEAAIAAGLIKGLQQLALVGDHKQLQATCNVKALEEEPYNMKISLFERLINNSIPYVMLNKQRRMVPEIRKLLTLEPEPFYRGLTDHPSVLDRVVDRPHVPGMEKDLYFIQHEFPETVNQDGSRLNYDESEMIVGFINYLVLNGTDPDKITVLTASWTIKIELWLPFRELAVVSTCSEMRSH
ncbi:uncharacterized protein LY89DRAFT_701455 [Mollisia scopiformis]|uniref:Uncharacterized protein n=1 Tax=Mollisia scopiformis TaxID=149040 RepID=A0A132BCT1_MOLSC|nr:uncharacterized protein LY89DRAFT_701455 [Mollisia scopiformis]KUJ09467.1 hypothetical protein LY89DRAFT_701455 [Mollisia scopiformis]